MTHEYIEVPAAAPEEHDRGLVDVYGVCTDPDCRCIGEWLVVEGVEPERKGPRI